MSDGMSGGAPPGGGPAAGDTADRPTAARRTAGLVWKSIAISLGVILLLLGLVCLVLPGPGVLLILAGLALLSPHSRWAHGLMQRVKDLVNRHRRQAPDNPPDGSDP